MSYHRGGVAGARPATPYRGPDLTGRQNKRLVRTVRVGAVTVLPPGSFLQIPGAMNPGSPVAASIRQISAPLAFKPPAISSSSSTAVVMPATNAVVAPPSQSAPAPVMTPPGTTASLNNLAQTWLQSAAAAATGTQAQAPQLAGGQTPTGAAPPDGASGAGPSAPAPSSSSGGLGVLLVLAALGALIAFA